MLVATHEGSKEDITPTTLAAVVAILKNEFGHHSAYSDVGFDEFAKQTLARKSPDGSIDHSTWSEGKALAGPICSRSDIKALVLYLAAVLEHYMYEPLALIGEIALAYNAQPTEGVRNLPPDPYAELVDGKWVKTAEAREYTPTIAPKFSMVDVHHKPLLGLLLADK